MSYFISYDNRCKKIMKSLWNKFISIISKMQMAYKPGSISEKQGEVFIWGASYLTPRATEPDDDSKTNHVPSLFCLALRGGGALPPLLPRTGALIYRRFGLVV